MNQPTPVPPSAPTSVATAAATPATVPDGGPAFPQKGNTLLIKDGVMFLDKGGMSLRDYFAAKVAGGDAAAGEGGWGAVVPDEILSARVKLYYRIADAMLAERNKHQ